MLHSNLTSSIRANVAGPSSAIKSSRRAGGVPPAKWSGARSGVAWERSGVSASVFGEKRRMEKTPSSRLEFYS